MSVDSVPVAAGRAPLAFSDGCASTESQQEVWLASQFSPEASMGFNEAVVLDFRGPLNVPALVDAISAVVARHDSLHSWFSRDGSRMLVAGGAVEDIKARDFSALDEPACQEALSNVYEAAVTTPFALDQGPLFKALLCKVSATRHELVLSAHHAVCDGWSWGVIVDELARLYSGFGNTAAILSPAPSYKDYSRLQQQAANSAEMGGHVDYWVEKFQPAAKGPQNPLPILDLPIDHPRASSRTFKSRRLDRVLPASTLQALRYLAAQQGRSLFVTLLAGFAATLHRITGQAEQIIGIPAAGQLAVDMPGLVGHCVNLLPLRLATPPHLAFDALMSDTSGLVLDAFEHQALTYGALVRQLVLPRDPHRAPLVSVMFNLDADASRQLAGFSGLEVAQRTLPRAYENFELFLNLVPGPEGLRIETQYNADLFDGRSVSNWLEIFEVLLLDAVRDAARPIGDMAVMSPGQAAALAALQPAPRSMDGDALMHAGFVGQAARHPDHLAVQMGDDRCSYAALDALSNRWARLIRSRGVVPGEYVGICLERGVGMVAALLAVLKSGAAYVPLDPDFPQARLKHYAEDAKLALLLTRSSISTAPRTWCEGAEDRIFDVDDEASWTSVSSDALEDDARDPRPGNPAYVIYTSGSTGTPKGVCISHGAAANFMEAMHREPGLLASDIVAAVTTLSFDIAVAEILLPLSVGACVQLVSREDALDGQRLMAVLENSGATVLQATPGTWRLLIDAGWQGSPQLRCWIGGESVPPSLAFELLDRCADVFNLYGPTETTVWSTAWHMQREVVASRGVAIGRPLANTGVWVLDEKQRLCPMGLVGEICISGLGLALGYLNRPELTADRFMTVSILGVPTRIYRTGDRGRWRTDGRLEHRGRLDFQIKLRGYRIEPGEIEARCTEVDGVARCVVLVREDRPGDFRLVAYLTLATGGTFDRDLLDQHLRAHLPNYMVPQHIVVLPALALLPNGKVNRQMLPAPQAEPRDLSKRVLPANERERQVLAAMEKVLSLPGLDMHDDFFRVGGHSLLAARLANQLGKALGSPVPMRLVFESPTPLGLSRAIDHLMAQGAGVSPGPALSRLPGRKIAPLTRAQERIRFLEELHPGRSVYNTPSAQRWTGPIDVVLIESMLQDIAGLQPAFRTSIGVDPQTRRPVQLIAEEAEVSLPLFDLTDLPADQREAELMERLQELADRPIALGKAPLLHAALFRLDDEEHVFLLVPHHLIWDGWSFDVLQQQMAAIYLASLENRPPTLAALPTTHGDYAEWLETWLAGPECDKQLLHWKQRFARTPTLKAATTDMPRRAGMSGQGGSQWIVVDEAQTERLRSMARDTGVTLSMFCLGIYALLISSVIGTSTVVIANPVRGRETPETEDVIGFFNNVLPLALEVDTTLPLRDFMQYVRQEMLSLMGYQQLPFERMVMEPEFARVKGAGLYQAMFSFQDARERPAMLGPMKVTQIHLLQRGATDDLGLWLMDKPGGLQGSLVYNADLYLRETAAHLRDRFLELLSQAAHDSHVSLEHIARATDSPSAAYLQRMASSQPAALSPDGAGSRPAGPVRPLLPPAQMALAKIWAQVMTIDIDDIGADDNFFDLGGDSLLAMRAVQRADAELALRIEPRRYLFESLGQLATPTLPSLQTVEAMPKPAYPRLRPHGAVGNSATLLRRVMGGWGRRS